MTIDLKAAIEVARDEMDDWETFRAGDGHLSIRMKSKPRTPAEVIARIAPIIEAAVREQVARDIEAEAAQLEPVSPYWLGTADGCRRAARIARATP